MHVFGSKMIKLAKGVLIVTVTVDESLTIIGELPTCSKSTNQLHHLFSDELKRGDYFNLITQNVCEAKQI